MGWIGNNGSAEVENKCHSLFPGCRGKVQGLLTQIIWEWIIATGDTKRSANLRISDIPKEETVEMEAIIKDMLEPTFLTLFQKICSPCSRKRLWKAFLPLLGALPSGAVVCKAVQGSGIHILGARGGALEEKCITDREYKFSVAFLEKSRLVVSCYF